MYYSNEIIISFVWDWTLELYSILSLSVLNITKHSGIAFTSRKLFIYYRTRITWFLWWQHSLYVMCPSWEIWKILDFWKKDIVHDSCLGCLLFCFVFKSDANLLNLLSILGNLHCLKLLIACNFDLEMTLLFTPNKC